MKTKRTHRRETFSETVQLSFIFKEKNNSARLCDFCQEESIMLAPETIAAATVIGAREIYRQIEAGTVHFIEISGNRVFVCLKTLLETVGKSFLRIEEKANGNEIL